MTTTRRWWALAAAGTLLALAAGCSASSSHDSSAGAPAARDAEVKPQAQGGPAERAPAAKPQAQGAYDSAVAGKPRQGAATQVKREPTRDTRAIIYKGEITVRIDSVTEKAARASTIATAAGGFVGGDTRRADGSESSADLILRVPSKEFYNVVNQVAHLGHEVSRGINTDDVTQQSADLETRIASQKASVERTRALMAKAEKIEEIVTIEGELGRREADLGSMEAEQRVLADQVALSTVTVHLITPTSAKAPASTPDPTFLSGLAAGWGAFTASVRWLLVVVGALLPFAVVIAIPAVLWIRFARRRRPEPVAPPAEA